MNSGDQCLTDADLSRLLGAGDELGTDPNTTTHLGHCRHCQSRLEVLAGGTDWISTGSLPTPEPDDQLPVVEGYTIESLIGSGGMGRVFRATDNALGRTVAIKFLAPQIAASQSARDRFLREARAAAALQHPNLVAIYHIGNAPSDALPYFVMEFVDGPSLTTTIDATPLPLSQILPIATQVARALEAAHAGDIIHRDIKPDNVLLTAGSSTVKVTDFGLARTTSDTAVTIAGQLPGTPDYMSPEQALGQPADSRSDLWSFGCLLFEMATGNRPFNADTPIAVLRKIIDDPPPSLPATLPEGFTSLVRQLLEKAPDQRPSSATAVLAQLSVLQDLPEKKHPPRKSKRYIAAAIAVASAVTLTTLISVALNAPSPPPPQTIAPPPPPPIASGPQPEPAQPEIKTIPTTTTVHRIPADGSEPITYHDLQAALDAAAPGDTIELDWDGPASFTKLDIKPPDLSLRPKPGRHPVILFTRARGWLVRVRSNLQVEGIEIRWSKPGVTASESQRRSANTPGFPNNTLIIHEAGDLVFSHCRIVVELPYQIGALPPAGTPYADIRPIFKRTAIKAASATNLTLESTELYAPDSTAIEWQGDHDCSLRIHNSLVVASTAALATAHGTRACRIDLENSTLLCNRLLHLLALPDQSQLLLASKASAIQAEQLLGASSRARKETPLSSNIFRWTTAGPTALEVLTPSVSYLPSLLESTLPAAAADEITRTLPPGISLAPLQFAFRNWRQNTTSVDTWDTSQFVIGTADGSPIGCPTDVGPSAYRH